MSRTCSAANAEMDAYLVRLHGDELHRLADAFRRGGCATSLRDDELLVLIPLPVHDGSSEEELHMELAFFLRQWKDTRATGEEDIVIVDERPARVDERAFHRLRS
jgi:hypothetical protein